MKDPHHIKVSPQNQNDLVLVHMVNKIHQKTYSLHFECLSANI